MLGGLAGLLGLAAGDDRRLAGGAQALLELFDALERERQLGLHGDDPLVALVRRAAGGFGGLAGAGELRAQDVEAARGRLGDVADVAELGAQRGGALSPARRSASTASPVSSTVVPSRSTCAPTASSRSRPAPSSVRSAAAR